MVVLLKKVILLVIFGLVSACSSGGGGGNDSAGGISGNTASVVSINPTPIFLRNDSAITITFNQSIDTTIGSWQISGGMAVESDGGVWSSNVVPNDTLTISPAVTWAAKPNRSIGFDATDAGGNVIASFALSYDVYRGTLYFVDGSMPDDTGDGLSPATARKFIHTAVADATQPATVLVNTGNYLVNHTLSTHVVLRGHVSLYGGYSIDFSERNTVDYPTIIEDVSAVPGATSEFNSAIKADGVLESIDSETLIDGFIIKGTTQPDVIYAAAIMLDSGASPTINNNQIYGADTISQFGIGAVMIGNSSPIVSNNRIYGGNSPFVAGVLVGYGGTPRLFNNVIHGGNSIYVSAGIAAWGTNPVIRNNTIYSGQSDTTETGVLIQIDESVPFAQPVIDNNIIYSTSDPGSSCIAEAFSPPASAAFGSIDPESLKNNNLFSCEIYYLDTSGGCSGNADGDNSSVTCALEELNALTGVVNAVGNNVSVAADFVDLDGLDNDINTMDDNDWHLSSSNSTSITTGGLNGFDQVPVWSFSTDADGNIRPASGNPWSIGAYEFR